MTYDAALFENHYQQWNMHQRKDSKSHTTPRSSKKDALSSKQRALSNRRMTRADVDALANTIYSERDPYDIVYEITKTATLKAKGRSRHPDSRGTASDSDSDSDVSSSRTIPVSLQTGYHRVRENGRHLQSTTRRSEAWPIQRKFETVDPREVIMRRHPAHPALHPRGSSNTEGLVRPVQAGQQRRGQEVAPSQPRHPNTRVQQRPAKLVRREATLRIIASSRSRPEEKPRDVQLVRCEDEEDYEDILEVYYDFGDVSDSNAEYESELSSSSSEQASIDDYYYNTEVSARHTRALQEVEKSHPRSYSEKERLREYHHTRAVEDRQIRTIAPSFASDSSDSDPDGFEPWTVRRAQRSCR